MNYQERKDQIVVAEAKPYEEFTQAEAKDLGAFRDNWPSTNARRFNPLKAEMDRVEQKFLGKRPRR